jgi:hypothetical protein
MGRQDDRESDFDPGGYRGTERRASKLTRDDYEAIANIMEERFFANVGKALVKRLLYAVGTGGGFIGVWEAIKALGKP